MGVSGPGHVGRALRAITLPCVLLVVAGFAPPTGLVAQTRVDIDVPVVPPADRPSLSLGEQGGAAYEFYRVAGAVRLDDGRLAVLDVGSHQLRIYAPDGTFERAHGGEGEGPGEYTRPARLFRTPGDSLIVWDAGAVRASVVSPDDGFARTVALEPRPEAPTLQGVSASGRLVVSAMHFSLENQGTLTRMPESRFLHGPDGSRMDSLGLAPGRAGLIRASPGRVEVLGPLVAVTTTYGVGAEVLWVETGEQHGVDVQSLATGEARSFTWDGPPLEMTDAFVRALKEEALRGVDDPEIRRQLERSNEIRPVPDRIPATRSVLADREGNGWVELAAVPGADGPAVWIVLTPEGRVVRRVELPRRMTLADVAADRILVVERDDFDLEYVRLYELVPG